MPYSNIKLFIHLIFFSLLTSCVQEKVSDPVPAHDSFTIDSQVMNEVRVVNVWTPVDYTNLDKPLPVVYMLDGGVKEDFPHIANTLSSLIANGDIAPAILVGIENTERRRDLTGPSDIAKDAEIAPITDGSSKFRNFFKTELFVEINKRYPVNQQRAIVGESVAGLFIVETLFLEPSLFDIYLAIDPSLWWNNHHLVSEAANLLKTFPEKNLKFWFAGSDAIDIFQHTENMHDSLKNHSPKNLEWLYLPQPKEQHHTIFRATKEAAFKWGLWKLPIK